MSQAFVFPENFLWGTATAAHQVEGNNLGSDSWVLEHVPGTLYAEPSGDACDHYHRYPQDIALLGELGFNTYRFSVEWARIEPEEGEFSQAATLHYRRMLESCHQQGLTPLVTFHHFTSPRWLMAKGGWQSDQTPGYFARYCEWVTRHLGHLIGGAFTLNEANIAALLHHLVGLEAPLEAPWWGAAAKALQTTPDHLAPFQHLHSAKARQTILQAHRLGFQAIKAGPGEFPVGLSLAIQDVQALPGGEERAEALRQEIYQPYFEAVRGDDFLGVQTYSRERVGAQGPAGPEPGAELTQMGYEFYPEALECAIRYAVSQTGLPVLVSENGVATPDDTRRVEYIRRALQGVAHCLRDGLEVQGYTYWSAFDNFEWVFGYRPTFGLIAVNRQTQERMVKPSARWLGSIARANAL